MYETQLIKRYKKLMKDQWKANKKLIRTTGYVQNITFIPTEDTGFF